MNTKLANCAVLLFLLISVSMMGSVCEVTCVLATPPGHHHSPDASMTHAMNMAAMSAAEVDAYAEFTCCSNCAAQCPLGQGWLTGQKSPEQPVAVVHLVQPGSRILAATLSSAPTTGQSYTLRQQIHRASTVLRI